MEKDSLHLIFINCRESFRSFSRINWPLEIRYLSDSGSKIRYHYKKPTELQVCTFSLI